MNTYVWIHSLSDLREGDRVTYADDVSRRIMVERASAWEIDDSPLRFVEDSHGNVVRATETVRPLGSWWKDAKRGA